MNLSAQSHEPTPMPECICPNAHLPIQVTHDVFVGRRCTKGVCTELNGFGMRADIPHPLAVGDVVNVNVAVPDVGFEAFARITYRNRYHYGLYFVDMDDGQRDRLATLLEGQKNPAVC